MNRNDIDFIDLGDGQYILRCEVNRDLQQRYDAARSRYAKDAGVAALRQLNSVRDEIRRLKPDEVVKSDSLPVLEKSASGPDRVVCTYEGDPAGDALTRAAHDASMRHRHGGYLLPDCMLSKASLIRDGRKRGSRLDISKAPDHLRRLYEEALRAYEAGETEAEKEIAARAYNAILGDIAVYLDRNNALSAGRPGARIVTAAEVRPVRSYP
jgi:hypothetical protein